MDLTPYVEWIVFLHIAGAFLFVAGHGVSIFVAFQLRKERDRARLGALLDLSGKSLSIAYLGLLILFFSGIVAGIVLGSFGRWWIWISLVLLIVIASLMTPVGSMYFNRIRLALGQRIGRMKATDPDPVPLPDADLAALLMTRAAETLLFLGGGGFLVILWLMRFKPF